MKKVPHSLHCAIPACAILQGSFKKKTFLRDLITTLFTVVGVSELLLHHTRCFPVGRPQWTASVMFLTWVNFRRSPLPGVRLGPILVCSDLTELDAKRDLAVAAQTVYPPC